jgi:diaminohydroxyphosphoribosylaminopyrimidine deaminase/5-amino-6-(5-phosphoribosylamino)uracil reductase
MDAESDYRYMARALRLARRGLYTTDPNPRVGCVLVHGNEIVGEGWHERAGEPHAEVIALRAAGERARGATCYVTLEPCCHHGRTPPCSAALIAAGVSRVVAAGVDPDPRVSGQGLQQLRQAGISVEHGLLGAQAEALNRGFVQRLRVGRPLVRCKLGMSLDGRTAMASGESKWITGPDSRRDVQRLRARSSAVLTGIGTVLADDPSLAVRPGALSGEGPEDEVAWRQPLRVVVDPNLSTPEDARVLQPPGSALIVTCTDDRDLGARLMLRGAEVVVMPNVGGVVDLHALLRLLAERAINEVLVETGATLSGAMLRAGLVDELVFYMAPKLMGSQARPLFQLPGLDTMDQAIDLQVTDMRAVGADWRITARVASAATAA